MRLLVDSGDDDIPEDVIKANSSFIEEHRRLSRESARYVVPEVRSLNYTGEGRKLLVDEPPEISEFKELKKLHPQAAYPLERWLVQAHAYSEEQAAKVGILGRLFSGEVKRVKGGVIHDAKRFSIVETESARKIEVGVAVRLSVATSNLRAGLDLTLPNLAADAQLNSTDARIGITVIGYTCPLGDLLPAPRKLDVETCVEHIEAFRKIQTVIFGEAGWQYVVPTTLSYEEG